MLSANNGQTQTGIQLVAQKANGAAALMSELGQGSPFSNRELQQLGLTPQDNYIRIEFDNGSTIMYTFCAACGVATLSLMFLPFFILCCPCICCGISGQVNARRAAITNNQIVYKSMTYSCCCCCENETVKTVPLSKITDLSIHQSCVQNCFGLQQINVETASSPAPEIVLV